jgi:hypothetical protein
MQVSTRAPTYVLCSALARPAHVMSIKPCHMSMALLRNQCKWCRSHTTGSRVK